MIVLPYAPPPLFAELALSTQLLKVDQMTPAPALAVLLTTKQLFKTLFCAPPP
jgi:hypothetical protein